MSSTTMINGQTIKATREEIALVISGIAWEGSTGIAYTATPADLQRHAEGTMTVERLTEVCTALVVGGLVDFTLVRAPGALGSIGLGLTGAGEDWAEEDQRDYERENGAD